MTVTEEDKQAVGYTDMRLYQNWLAKADPVTRMLALKYPPSVYRLTLGNGDVGPRVFPVEYGTDSDGRQAITVLVIPGINPELSAPMPYRITGVEPDKLTPIKWPPDARIH